MYYFFPNSFFTSLKSLPFGMKSVILAWVMRMKTMREKSSMAVKAMLVVMALMAIDGYPRIADLTPAALLRV